MEGGGKEEGREGEGRREGREGGKKGGEEREEKGEGRGREEERVKEEDTAYAIHLLVLPHPRAPTPECTHIRSTRAA